MRREHDHDQCLSSRSLEDTAGTYRPAASEPQDTEASVLQASRAQSLEVASGQGADFWRTPHDHICTDLGIAFSSRIGSDAKETSRPECRGEDLPLFDDLLRLEGQLRCRSVCMIGLDFFSKKLV